jgi:gamma-glutamylcyclotransferase (GGCT)/AIG2-like uncharacterized protein YtfP
MNRSGGADHRPLEYLDAVPPTRRMTRSSVLYFAYGSNLDPEQMRSRCPGHRTVGLARLPDHRLTFPLYSETWQGGAAGLALAHGETVWGALYELTDDDLAALDRYEGWKSEGHHHNLYDREKVSVELTRADDGSVPGRKLAIVYLARPVRPAAPSRRYMETVLRGARHHRLPPEYIEKLEAIPTADPARAN